MLRIFKLLVSISLGVFLASSSLADPSDTGELTGHEQRKWIEKYAPGYMVSWILAEIAHQEPTETLHHKLSHLYVPVIRGIDHKIKVGKLTVDEQHAHVESVALNGFLAEAASKPFNKDVLAEAITRTKTFIENGFAETLNEVWIRAGRIGDFSNSLSAHATSGGLDLQGIAKMIEYGPAILDGSKKALDGQPLLESSRHLGAHNPVVMHMTWLNLIKKALSVESKLRAELFAAYQDARFGDILDAVVEEYNKLDIQNAKKSKIGLFQLLEDAKIDSIEFVRGYVFSSIFFANGDVSMAFSVFFEHVGEILDILSRNRKFVQLHPYGNQYLHTVSNALHLCYLAASPKQHYVMVLKRRFDRLNELETFSEEWHTQFQQIVQVALQPALDVVLFYSKPDQLVWLGSFINRLTFGGAGVVYAGGEKIAATGAGLWLAGKVKTLPGATAVGRAHLHLRGNSRQYLNWFQWLSYTAIQAGKAAWWTTDQLQELVSIPVGYVRSGINTVGSVSIVALTAKVYAGALGDPARAFTVHAMGALWGASFGEGICKGVFGTGCLEYGYGKVNSWIPWSKKESVARQEL